jgi:single-strand DNA-binding protein
MMQNLNVVALIGNLTRDPELRHTPSGTPVCKLRIAVNDRVKRGEEWMDTPYYFDITVWGKQGENCAQYLSKGRPIGVNGKLTWREWEANDGSGKRQAVEIVADRVQFLNKKSDDSNGDYSRSGDYGTPSSADMGVPSASSEPDFVPASSPDDDIPF